MSRHPCARPTTLPPTPLLTVLQRPTELQPTPSPPRMHLPVLHVPDQSMHPLTHQSTPNDPDSPEPRSPTVFYNIPPMPLPPSQLPPPAAPAQPPPGQCTLLLIKAPQMIQIVQNHGPRLYFITFHLCHYPPHNCHHQQHQHSHLQGSSTTNNYIIYPRGHHGGHPSATPRNPLRLKARAGDRAGGGAGAGAGAGARASPGTSNANASYTTHLHVNRLYPPHGMAAVMFSPCCGCRPLHQVLATRAIHN